MMKLIVLYGQPTDVAAFEAYYASTHMPLVLKIPSGADEHGHAIAGSSRRNG